MSEAWSIYVMALATLTVVVCLGVLYWTMRMTVDSDEENNTTGHVWDEDIVEGNNPLPRWWMYSFWLTAVYLVGYLVVYPGFGNMAGTFGWTQINQYEAEVALADEKYGDIFAVYADMSLSQMATDPDAIKLGRNIYMNRCATCHGSDGRGAKGFPNLTADVWLYGGAPETIQATISNGRNGVMPALGAALGEQATNNVAAYVLSLSGRDTGASVETLESGKQSYMTMCIACHGATGTGNTALGAANLTDDVWLHGSAEADVRDVITNGRMSQMPAQRNALSEDRIRTVAAYVLSLNGAAGE
jgi:cytochrome c oxidase cbb3-type subunit 3